MFDKSDFKQRKHHAFARKRLKDQRKSNEFSLLANGTYSNDPSEAEFEIYKDGQGKRYLVFLLSVFKISMAYDDELMMREFEIGLAISPELSKNSFF